MLGVSEFPSEKILDFHPVIRSIERITRRDELLCWCRASGRQFVRFAHANRDNRVSVCLRLSRLSLVSGVPSSCNPRMNPVARSLPARNHPLNSHTNFVFTKATKLVSHSFVLQFCKVPSISGMIRDKKRCVCVCCFSCFGNLLCLDNFSSIHFCLCGIRVVTRTRGKDLKTSWHQEKHHEFMVYAEAHQGRCMVFGTSTGILDLQPSRHSSICKKHHKYVWILNTFLTYYSTAYTAYIYT